ncbi:unnamed protein product, partial [Medioppia subpectinata]
NTIAIIPFATYVAGLVCSFGAKPMSARLGSRWVLILGAAFGISTCVWIFIGADGQSYKTWQIYGVSAFVGIGGTALLISSLALTSDLIGSNTSTGAFVFAAMSFFDKSVNGIVIALLEHFNPKDIEPGQSVNFYRLILIFITGTSSVVILLGLLTIMRTRSQDMADEEPTPQPLNQPLNTGANEGADDTPQPDSMDRFGDELCEVLLSRLPLEDRFRCETVSKRFQRTVFASVKCAAIDDQLISRVHRRGVGVTVAQSVAIIGRKCPNIERIDTRGMRAFNDAVPAVLATLCDSCHDLPDIYCNLRPMSGDAGGQWIAPFASLITRVGDLQPSVAHWLRQCPRVTHLTAPDVQHLFDGPAATDQLLATNLRHLGLAYRRVGDNDRLGRIGAGNPGLLSVRLSIGAMADTDMMVGLTGLFVPIRASLRRLDVTLAADLQTHRSLKSALAPVAVNCHQLVRLSARMTAPEPDIALVLASPEVRHIFGAHPIRPALLEPVDWRVFAPLVRCPALAHISLDGCHPRANWFRNCAQHWPAVRTLAVRETRRTIDTNGLADIAAMPLLRELTIEDIGGDVLVRELAVEGLFARNPKLAAIAWRADGVTRIFARP